MEHSCVAGLCVMLARAAAAPLSLPNLTTAPHGIISSHDRCNRKIYDQSLTTTTTAATVSITAAGLTTAAMTAAINYRFSQDRIDQPTWIEMTLLSCFKIPGHSACP